MPPTRDEVPTPPRSKRAIWSRNKARNTEARTCGNYGAIIKLWCFESGTCKLSTWPFIFYYNTVPGRWAPPLFGGRRCIPLLSTAVIRRRLFNARKHPVNKCVHAGFQGSCNSRQRFNLLHPADSTDSPPCLGQLHHCGRSVLLIACVFCTLQKAWLNMLDESWKKELSISLLPSFNIIFSALTNFGGLYFLLYTLI